MFLGTLVLAAAGCAGPLEADESGNAPHEKPSSSPPPDAKPPVNVTCALTLCLANPNHPEVQAILRDYGVHLLTNGAHVSLHLDGEGEWLTINHRASRHYPSYAINLTEPSVESISVDPSNFSGAPRISGDRIVLAQGKTNPATGNPEPFQHYLYQGEGMRPPDRNLTAYLPDGTYSAVPSDYDHPLVAVTVEAPNASGIYALNVEDGELKAVVLTNFEEGNRSIPRQYGGMISNGRVYINVNHGEDGENHLQQLYEYNLSTDQIRSIHALGPRGNYLRMGASYPHVVWTNVLNEEHESKVRLRGGPYILNVETGDGYFPFPLHPDLWYDFPTMAGDWLVAHPVDQYQASTISYGTLVGHHLPSNRSYTLLLGDQAFDAFGVTGTDGERVFFACAKYYPHWEEVALYDDTCWSYLPELDDDGNLVRWRDHEGWELLPPDYMAPERLPPTD